MALAAIQPIPRLDELPKTLPLENAVRIELVDGVPILRAASVVQARIESLLDKQCESKLTNKEARELELYEEIDDYLSFVNRTIRNLQISPQAQ